MTIDQKLTKEQFCERFKAHMLKIAGGKFDDETSVAEYAEMTGPSYYEDQMKLETPEDCADADMSYWGE